jgi:hypothetical protein
MIGADDSGGNLLLLCHRIPYPPDKGDKIRSFRWMMALAARYRVHLAAFVDDADDWQHAPRLREICDEVCLVPLHARRAKLRSLPALLTGCAADRDLLPRCPDGCMDCRSDATSTDRPHRRVLVGYGTIRGAVERCRYPPHHRFRRCGFGQMAAICRAHSRSHGLGLSARGPAPAGL